MSHWSPLAPQRNAKWTGSGQTKTTTKVLEARGRQPLRQSLRPRQSSKRLLRIKRCCHIGKQSHRGDIHDEEGMIWPTDIMETVLANIRDTTPLIVVEPGYMI